MDAGHLWDAGKRVRASLPAPKKKDTPFGVSFFFGAFPFLPQAKMGRCGGLIEIVQEKPAKVFPAHTLFLATDGKNSLPLPVRAKRVLNPRSGRVPAKRVRASLLKGPVPTGTGPF